jgi:ubiquinone/menaquinone biosynthesis C-methylase UbiE
MRIRAGAKKISRKSCLTIERYLCSCQTKFWQNIFRAEVNYLLPHLVGSRDLLSIGCGPGIIEADLSDRGFRVTGLDLSREMLGHVPSGVRTVVARAEEMDFPKASFDAVISIVSLQFIEDYEKAVRKAAQVLRPNGKLLVMLLNPQSAFFREKARARDSYVRRIKHTDLEAIEQTAEKYFSVQTEYFLGVRGEAITESRDPSEAVLFIIRGSLKPSGKG